MLSQFVFVLKIKIKYGTGGGGGQPDDHYGDDNAPAPAPRRAAPPPRAAAPAPAPRAPAPKSSTGFDDMDDDIPFLETGLETPAAAPPATGQQKSPGMLAVYSTN